MQRPMDSADVASNSATLACCQAANDSPSTSAEASRTGQEDAHTKEESVDANPGTSAEISPMGQEADKIGGKGTDASPSTSTETSAMGQEASNTGVEDGDVLVIDSLLAELVADALQVRS